MQVELESKSKFSINLSIRVILPEKNKKDIEEISKEIRKNMT
jgi:hypothetical protein